MNTIQKLLQNEKWADHNKVLNIFKNSKNGVLSVFYCNVDRFMFTTTNNGRNILNCINKNGKRIDRNQKPIECVEILTFAKNTPNGNEIKLSHYAKNGNINITFDKLLTFKDEGGKIFGNLRIGEDQNFEFELKDNRVSRFSEVKTKKDFKIKERV